MPQWNAGDEITAAKLNFDSVIKDFTYGETIAINESLYLKTSDQKVYKTDADFDDERIHNFVGFAKENGNANDVKKVQIGGKVEDFVGLTPGSHYYLSNTAGAISATMGTYSKLIGVAISSTELIIKERSVVLAGWQKIKDEVVPSNVQQYNITGLDLAADKAYMIVVNGINQASEKSVALLVNGDTTLTNYYTQRVTFDSTTVTAGRGNNPYMFSVYLGNGASYSFTAFMNRIVGRGARWSGHASIDDETAVKVVNFACHQKIAADANITQISLYSEYAQGIGAGTRITIFAIRG